MQKNLIKEHRQRLGLSQVELARKTRMAPPNLSAIERGRLLPWPKVKRDLARVLGVSEAELFPNSQGDQDAG